MSSNLPATMKVIEMSGPGGPDVLRPAERPLPQPKAGEVLIKVAAAGVNGPDLMQRKGLYPAPAGAPGPARPRSVRRSGGRGQ